MRTKHIVILILVGVLVLLLCFFGWQKIATPAKWQEQYDLGIRYLSEGNYQEAIIAFAAAIEIDEKRPEAYLQAAEAYKAVGDYDAAKEILEKGYNATGDESLKFRDEVQELITDNFITPEELTLGGVPFYETDVDSASMAYPGIEINRHETVTNCFTKTHSSNGYWVPLQFTQMSGEPAIVSVTYLSGLHDPELGETIDDSYKLYQPEFRNITIEMSMEEIMRRLGFSEQGISQLLDAVNNHDKKSYESFDGNIQISTFHQPNGDPCLSISWEPIDSENFLNHHIFLMIIWDNTGFPNNISIYTT